MHLHKIKFSLQEGQYPYWSYIQTHTENKEAIHTDAIKKNNEEPMTTIEIPIRLER